MQGFLGADQGDSFSRGPNDLQKEEEDLDNVHVDGERTEDVLLRADGVLAIPNEKLRVVGQKQGKGNRPNCCIQHVQPWYVFE